MMRLQLGAVLLSLQLCIAAAIAQTSESDIVSCYTECRDDIQASEDGWECSGSQECNCRTDGYLERLGCCMQDLCDTPIQAVFQIPCSPSGDDDEVRFAEASCPATTSVSSTASATTTGRFGINAITSSAEEEETTTSSTTTTSTTSSEPSSTDDALTAADDNSSAPSEESSDSDNSLALGLGLGLGIPLSLAVAGILAFLFYRTRQRRRAAEAEVAAAAAANNDPRQKQAGDGNPFSSPEPPVYELSSAGNNAEPLPPNELPTQADDAMDAIPTHTEYPPSRSTSSAAASVATTSEKRSIIVSNSAGGGGRQTPDITSGGGVAGPRGAPRLWDSQSTLTSLGNGPGSEITRPMSTIQSRSIRSLPSRSVRSTTSEMLMRDLPDLPPAANQGPRSPEIKTISELP